MLEYSVAVIGTGNPEGETGNYGIAYAHAEAWTEIDECDIVACADIVEENASTFAKEYGLQSDDVYTDYGMLLTEREPDIVSVCTPHDAHTDIVIGCARSGVTEAIHCEKPMAATWGECKEMVRACDRAEVQLTFNHQRRFDEPFVEARKRIENGEIGELEQVAFSIGDLFTYGSHSFDLCGYFNEDRPAEWVIAQIDYPEENVVLGSHNEQQALVQWQYDNGVYGLAATGPGSGLIDAHNRLVGSEGVIELLPNGAPVETFRIRRHGESEWETIEYSTDRLSDYWARAFRDVPESLAEDRESELAAEKALQSTEITFAAWESTRRRGRVDLPLDIENNPLAAMVKAGKLPP